MLANPASSFCPFLVVLLSSSPPPLVLLVLWPRWRTLCLPPASSGHVFEPCGSSVFPAVLVPRSQSRSACPACARCGPAYHRLTRGLPPAWPRRFSYLHRLVWVCFHVAMNAIVTQRSKCDITIGSSHDKYPVSHRSAHVTQASGTGVFQHLLFRYSSQSKLALISTNVGIFGVDADADKNADAVHES